MKKKIDLSEIIKKKEKKKINKPTSKREEKNQEKKKKQKKVVKNKKNTDKGNVKTKNEKQIKQIINDKIKNNPYIRVVKKKQTDELTETKEFVGFLLNKEEYCIDSDYVRQIIKYRKPIDVGIKSKLVNGVINTKDGILAVIDLKNRFNLDETSHKGGSIIIINYADVRVGLFVDYLIGIVRLEADNIKNIPSFLPEHQMQYIKGVGLKKDRKIIVILNHNKLLDEDDMREIRSIPEDYK